MQGLSTAPCPGRSDISCREYSRDPFNSLLHAAYGGFAGQRGWSEETSATEGVPVEAAPGVIP